MVSPTEQEYWEFRRSRKQKELRTLFAFPIFPVSSNVFTNGKLLYCFRVESNYFSEKLT